MDPRSPSRKENPPIDAPELAQRIATLIDEKQGEDICILDVSGPLVIADLFVIASARNARHARAIAGDIVHEMKQHSRYRRHAAGLEGTGNWVLLDFDEVVVHIFQEDARAFYALEDLWGDVPRIPFTPAPRPADAPEPRDDWESFPDPIVPDSRSTR